MRVHNTDHRLGTHTLSRHFAHTESRDNGVALSLGEILNKFKFFLTRWGSRLPTFSKTVARLMMCSLGPATNGLTPYSQIVLPQDDPDQGQPLRVQPQTHHAIPVPEGKKFGGIAHSSPGGTPLRYTLSVTLKVHLKCVSMGSFRNLGICNPR